MHDKRPMKEITVIGSPVKETGLTDLMVCPFIEGMKKGGADVDLV